MIEQQASVHREGAGKSGQGNVSTGSDALQDHPYGLAGRFEGDRQGTNPEERAGIATESVDTTAKVRLANRACRLGTALPKGSSRERATNFLLASRPVSAPACASPCFVDGRGCRSRGNHNHNDREKNKVSITLEPSRAAVPGAGVLDKERIIAGPGFNRWLVPPAALAIHLCIGMAYGFSVFWLPLSKALATAGTGAKACGTQLGLFGQLFATDCDWSIATLGWMYTLFFVFLGCAAALWGGWLERAGPRKAGVIAALCWCGGMLISALGISVHQFWLMILGSGVIGGIGLGLGYISPVSTLIKWFPDRRGMATGMAIMGFGGGAMIGSPLAVDLMKHFSTPTSNGVLQTFIVLALIYFVFMVGGAFGYRVPATGWKPKGWTRPAAQTANAMITHRHVHVNRVWGIPQFWLIWMALTMNVSAGIGVIGMASPMLQEVFGGSLIDVPQKFAELDKSQLAAIAAVAGGFAALLSLFNIAGRFFWASLSDRLGRKATYSLFFVLGMILYASLPSLAGAGNKLLFVGAVCVIVSMYGGGFSTVPAYLADIFGTQFVGAIHGRILTAWSTAGIVGPVVVNYMREYQLGLGIPRDQVYNQTMYILVGMLAIGLLCNLLVRPLADKWFMTDAELEQEKRLAHEKAILAETGLAQAAARDEVTPIVKVWLAWLVVGVPLAWGVYRTLLAAAKFFH